MFIKGSTNSSTSGPARVVRPDPGANWSTGEPHRLSGSFRLQENQSNELTFWSAESPGSQIDPSIIILQDLSPTLCRLEPPPPTWPAHQRGQYAKAKQPSAVFCVIPTPQWTLKSQYWYEAIMTRTSKGTAVTTWQQLLTNLKQPGIWWGSCSQKGLEAATA